MTDDGRDTGPSLEGGLEELTEDMLHVMERLAGIDQAQAAVKARLEEVQRAVREMSLSHGRGLDALRRELVGERKALAARSAFDAVVSALDSSRRMRHAIDPQVDER